MNTFKINDQVKLRGSDGPIMTVVDTRLLQLDDRPLELCSCRQEDGVIREIIDNLLVPANGEDAWLADGKAMLAGWSRPAVCTLARSYSRRARPGRHRGRRLTTGGSVLQAIAAVEEMGASVVLVACIVDCLQGAAEKLAAFPFKPLLTIRDLGIVT